MHLLRIDASINGQRSASRELGDIVEARWRAQHPEAMVTRRDLHQTPIAPEALAAAVTAPFAGEAGLAPDQVAATTLAAQLVDEIEAADAVLVDSPLYNYGVSAQMKAWVDLIHTDPRSGGGSIPVLEGTPTVLVSTRGGSYGAGSPREGWDFATGYMRAILRDLWGADLAVVERELTLVGVNPALDRFAEAGEAQRAAATTAAHEAGEWIASLQPASLVG